MSEKREKTASRHLVNLQSQFAVDNPILQSAVKLFHELDQFEYDLGLLDDEDTTALQTSWWPIITFIGGNSGTKEQCLSRWLGIDIAPAHKTTVLAYSPQSTQSILPATALDVDHRYPFYRISHKMEQVQKGQGQHINTHLELKAINSPWLYGKLIIDLPKFIHSTHFDITQLLNAHSLEQSDIVLVFCDVFNSSSEQLKQLTLSLVKEQKHNKIVYFYDDTADSLEGWKQKLAAKQLTVGQFIALSALDKAHSPENEQLAQLLASAAHRRTYRVLHSLEKAIRDVENVAIAELKQGIFIWKERSTFSSVVILAFIGMLAVFGEVEMGLLELLLDPIIGTALLLLTIAIMVPTHIIFCKLHAKLAINWLNMRQRELGLVEQLVTMFEANLTLPRMMLPFSEPEGWNKKSKQHLLLLLDKTKELVQTLNDNLSPYNAPVPKPAPVVVQTPPPVVEQIAPPVVEQIAPPVAEQIAPPVQIPSTARPSPLMQKILKR